MEYIYDKLKKYSEDDYYGFHMPGHKRHKNFAGINMPFEIDITEIDGFDDLHHPKDLILDGQKRASKVYGSDNTYYVVNGSTTGLLSAVLGCTKKGDRILIARNCHKSVYHGIYMNELRPVYVYPSFDPNTELNGEIKSEDIETLINKYDDIKAVVITSPTYDGVISDIKTIAEVVHKKNIPLIVDEAHGAHFGFHPYFPERANKLGADVVINSLHKTLPALTMCGLIHINGNLANKKKIEKYLHIIQTSSPSYILMASIDSCIRFLENDSEKYFDEYAGLLENTRNELKKLKNINIIETENFDRSKIIISVKNTNLSGNELSHILLEKYHLQMEMAAGTYVLAMTTVADTKEGMERLVNALKEIDNSVSVENKTFEYKLPVLEQVYTVSNIEELIVQDALSTEIKCFSECVGKVSAEYAYVYPPGIPIIVPGERITKEASELLIEYEKLDFSIEGISNDGKLEVLIDG